MPDPQEGTPLPVPIRVTIEHITSRARLHGVATWHNPRLKILHANFALTGDYAFSAVTGCGRESRAKLWRLTEDSLRRALDQPEFVRRDPVRSRRRVSVAKPGDPRQVRIEGA